MNVDEWVRDQFRPSYLRKREFIATGYAPRPSWFARILRYARKTKI